MCVGHPLELRRVSSRIANPDPQVAWPLISWREYRTEPPCLAGQPGGGQQLFGIAYRNGQVFFARDPSGNPAEIYSISINPLTGELTGSESLEITLTNKRISDIAITADGSKLVVRCTPTHRETVCPQAVGLHASKRFARSQIRGPRL